MSLHIPEHYLVSESPELRDALEGLHDPYQGIIVCHITSGHLRNEQLSNDLLVALSKDLSKRQGSRNQAERWQRTCAWVAAYNPTDLVVVGADRVGWRAWQDLSDLASFADACLWLVMRSTTHKRYDREWLTRWRSWPSVDATTLLAELSQRRRKEQRSSKRAFPRAPEASFVLFRAMAYRGLSPEEFRVMDAAWADAVERARHWVAEQPSASEEAVARFLRRLVANCDTRDEVVTRLRGAQVGFFLADCLLLINERKLDLRAAQAPQSLSDEDIITLCEQQTAKDAAIALLGALSGADGDALAAVRIADVAVDGSAVSIGGRDVAIPWRARPILRAQRLWLRIAGTTSDAQPFLGSVAGHRPHAKKLQLRLTQLGEETGLRLADHWTRHVDETQVRWVQRYGVSIQMLHEEPRNPTGVGLR